jgi:hypothetical protein
MSSVSITSLVSNLVEKLHKIRVKLYLNNLKDVEGTYVARTEHETVLSIHDLAASLKNRAGFTGNVTDLIDYFEQLIAEIIYQLCDGYAVNIGILTIYPRVGGTWEHVNEVNDRKKHPITFNVRVSAKLNRMAEAITLECDGIADNPAHIDEVTDILSGTVNETLTPGGVIVISGHRIRIEGTKPEVGLQIVGTTKDAQAYSVAIAPPYVENKASKVIAVLPASIPDGTYRLQINTQYAGSGSLLKDIRVIISGADLIVGTTP